ncbi:hypothetical protein ABFU84_15195 [Xanthomonas translucens pv. undulosa]|uniref:hypothetical protein n=1 Tax=Xanthomonas campestris pv. translucens TaxID=343 RepID=UPI003CED6947
MFIMLKKWMMIGALIGISVGILRELQDYISVNIPWWAPFVPIFAVSAVFVLLLVVGFFDLIVKSKNGKNPWQ